MDSIGMSEFVTQHARSRLQQRGVSTRIADLFVSYADVQLHAGEGAVSVSMSRDTATMLLAEGVDPDAIRRVRKLAAVLGRQGLVTVLRPVGRKGRRYRRQFSTRAGQGD